MEQQSLKRKDLEVLIGSRARIAEVLDRKLGLSIAMIRRLNAELGIPAEILIRPSRRKVAYSANDTEAKHVYFSIFLQVR